MHLYRLSDGGELVGDGVDRVGHWRGEGLGLVLRDDTEAIAGAPERSEEIGVGCVGNFDERAVGKDDRGFD